MGFIIALLCQGAKEGREGREMRGARGKEKGKNAPGRGQQHYCIPGMVAS
jgi:hypothetical protein